MDTEHYVVEQTAPKWMTTALVTIGSGLVTVLLIWIASSQLELNTNVALMQQQMTNQEDKLDVYIKEQSTQIGVLDRNQQRVWPRLRTHGENIAILKREIEKVCDCDIELEEPEQF